LNVGASKELKMLWSNRVFAGRAIIIALMLSVVQCSGPVSQGNSKIMIGVILPLTGAAASLGKSSLQGMQIAIDNFNGTNQQPDKIGLVVEDDQAQPATAVAAYRKLVSSDRVKLILGPLTSGTTLAVAPIAERDKVIILSPGASAPALSGSGDYIFRNELSEEYGAGVQATLAFSRLGLRTIAMLYVNNEYGVGTARVFRKRFVELGGKITDEEAFSSGATDFRTAWEKIRSSGPQAVFVVFQDDIGNILKQRSELGIKIPVYTTPVFEVASNLKKLGSLAEGVIYTYYGTFDPSARGGSVGEFNAAYEKRFRDAPGYYAALGYDAASLMLEALKRSNFDAGKVKDSLYSIRGFSGVTGTMSFDAKGDVEKPVSLKVVRGGRFVAY
jgi:branched-chain amino acid transport system substrate-binding protein